MHRTALVMCLADPSGNPRPKRIINLMTAKGFAVDVLSYPPTGKLEIRRHLPIAPPHRTLLGRMLKHIRYVILRFIQYVCRYDNICDYFNDLDIDVLPYRKSLACRYYSLVVVENLQLLPLAFRIKKTASIIFDAREYYPRQAEDKWFFRWFEKPERIRLCRKYLPLCDQVITVSHGLAAEYQRKFGISCEVIMSVPEYHEINPRKTDPSRIRMVHHGIANRNRQIENMIDIMNLLDERFTLDLYLTSNPAYIRWLKSYAKNFPNVRFCDPVPFDAIIPMLSEYDIGLYYLEPKGFNVTYNLPNKLFEFIQARLLVAIGPSPDMAGIVRQYECGVIAESFSISAMADTIRTLSSKQIDQKKYQSHLAAKSLCYENESVKLLNIIQRFEA